MGTREVSLSQLALCIGDPGRRLGTAFVDSPWVVLDHQLKIANEKLGELGLVGSKSLERLGELVYSW